MKKKILAVLLFICYESFAQPSINLPRSTPGKEGVSATGILRFLDSAEKSKNEFHSFMLLRHGKVIAEGWWDPYKAGLKHTMYSCSKSFTATAIGFAVQEKLLNITDKVISFFPEELPDTVSTNLSELTVKDVLSMSDGQEPDPTFTTVVRDTNWIKAFLAVPLIHHPGDRFLYNSLGTYMLSAIVQKVTHQKVVDYLRPRLFDPLAIRDIDWEEDMKGINTGGWGLRINTEGMAKFGQLFLQKGKWQGKQLIAEDWVREASTMKIMQDPDASPSKKDSSDWLQGYCYQMWRCRNNAYRGDGAFGQFIIIMPDQDAVIAITAETADMQNEINLVWKWLLPALKNGKIKTDYSSEAQLAKRLKRLTLPVSGKSSSSLEKTIAGKEFLLDSNSRQLRAVSLTFYNSICTLKLETPSGDYPLQFGNAVWTQSLTSRPLSSLTSQAKENFSQYSRAKIVGSYHWKDNETLELSLRYIESPHAESFQFHFEQDHLLLTHRNSFDFGTKKTEINGHLR